MLHRIEFIWQLPFWISITFCVLLLLIIYPIYIKLIVRAKFNDLANGGIISIKQFEKYLADAFAEFQKFITVSATQRILSVLGSGFLAKLRSSLRSAGLFGLSNRIDFFVFAFASLLAFLSIILFLVLNFVLKLAVLESLFATLLFIGATLFLTNFILQMFSTKRFASFENSLPDIIDLISLGLQSGFTAEQSISKAITPIAKISVASAEELSVLLVELTVLDSRKVAFLNAAERLASSYSTTFFSLLMQADTRGASVVEDLQQLKQALITDSNSNLEAQLAKKSAYATLPMLVFGLPVSLIWWFGPSAFSFLYGS